MNESIFDVDQLCCPVSQRLLYRFIKHDRIQYSRRKGLSVIFCILFLKEIYMKPLRITPELTEIVFFKALH